MTIKATFNPITGKFDMVSDLSSLSSTYLKRTLNLSDVSDVATARSNLGLTAGGAGDIWVNRSGDTMTGDLKMGSNRIGIGTPTPAYPIDVRHATNPAVASVLTGNSIRASFLAFGSNSAYPRAVFKVGSGLGNSIANAGFWVYPDITGTVQKPMFLEAMTSSNTATTANKRAMLYQSTSYAMIKTSSGNGNYAGTPLRFLIQGLSVPHITLTTNGYTGINTLLPKTTLDVNGDRMRIRLPNTPATSTSQGYQGEVRWDNTYMYICVGTNNWKRTQLLTF